jgi:hypothetical protein
MYEDNQLPIPDFVDLIRELDDLTSPNDSEDFQNLAQIDSEISSTYLTTPLIRGVSISDCFLKIVNRNCRT